MDAVDRVSKAGGTDNDPSVQEGTVSYTCLEKKVWIKASRKKLKKFLKQSVMHL